MPINQQTRRCFLRSGLVAGVSFLGTAGLLRSAEKIIRSFIEDYHEKLARFTPKA
jgi:hypothetical protein